MNVKNTVPTPWEVIKGYNCSIILDRPKDDEQAQEVGCIHSPEHAAFIVTAVNSHAALVKALSAMHQQMIHFDRAWKDAGVGDIYEEVVNLAEQALKLAEGE